MMKMLHLPVTSLNGFKLEYIECQFIASSSQNLCYEQVSQLFLIRIHLSDITVFCCSSLIISLKQIEPLLSPKRASFLQKRVFCMEKFAMSLFRIIFAVGNGREAASSGFVFPECLRCAFALASLPEANTRRGGQGRKKQPSTLS